MDALVRALVESESEATVRDIAGHVGDQVHAVLIRNGMLMKTTGGAIAVGVMAAAQVLNDTFEFARRSLDDPEEAEQMGAAMRALFDQNLAVALQQPAQVGGDQAAMFARVRANAEKACFVAGDLFEIMQVISMAERFAAGEQILPETTNAEAAA